MFNRPGSARLVARNWNLCWGACAQRKGLPGHGQSYCFVTLANLEASANSRSWSCRLFIYTCRELYGLVQERDETQFQIVINSRLKTTDKWPHHTAWYFRISSICLGKVVKLQYCGQVSVHNLSSIPTNSGKWLKVDSTFHPSEVSKLSTQLAGGGAMGSLHN